MVNELCWYGMHDRVAHTRANSSLLDIQYSNKFILCEGERKYDIE